MRQKAPLGPQQGPPSALQTHVVPFPLEKVRPRWSTGVSHGLLAAAKGVICKPHSLARTRVQLRPPRVRTCARPGWAPHCCQRFTRLPASPKPARTRTLWRLADKRLRLGEPASRVQSRTGVGALNLHLSELEAGKRGVTAPNWSTHSDAHGAAGMKSEAASSQKSHKVGMGQALEEISEQSLRSVISEGLLESLLWLYNCCMFLN